MDFIRFIGFMQFMDFREKIEIHNFEFMKIKIIFKNKKTVFKSEVLNVNFNFFSEVHKLHKSYKSYKVH